VLETILAVIVFKAGFGDKVHTARIDFRHFLVRIIPMYLISRLVMRASVGTLFGSTEAQNFIWRKRMKTSCGLLLGLLFCHATFAKAPIVENHSLREINRLPAQSEALGLKSLDHYMDFSCEQLVERSDKDGFARYLKKEFQKLDSDFCSIVGAIDGEDNFSQAEQRRVGLGTFSKLVEGHYHEYPEGIELERFQDMSCSEYIESSEQDSFVSFFKAHLNELDSEICSKVGDYSGEDGPGSIGLGTYSKMVETAYWDYNRRLRLAE
jgi:hypothetical protein